MSRVVRGIARRVGSCLDRLLGGASAEGSEGEANENAADNPRIQDNEERERMVDDERRNVEEGDVRESAGHEGAEQEAEKHESGVVGEKRKDSSFGERPISGHKSLEDGRKDEGKQDENDDENGAGLRDETSRLRQFVYNFCVHFVAYVACILIVTVTIVTGYFLNALK